MYQLVALLFPVFLIGILSFVATAYLILFYRSKNKNYIHYIAIFAVSIVYSLLEVYSCSLLYLKETPWAVPDIYQIKSFVIMSYLVFLIFFTNIKTAKIISSALTAAFLMIILLTPQYFVDITNSPSGEFLLSWGIPSLFKYVFFLLAFFLIIVSSGKSDMLEVVEYSGKLPVESVFFSGFLIFDDFLISSLNTVEPLGNPLNIIRMFITFALIIIFSLTGNRHTQHRRHVEWIRSVFSNVIKGELDLRSSSIKKEAVCWVVDPETEQIEYVNSTFDRIWLNTRTLPAEKYKLWVESIHEDDFDYVFRSYKSLAPESELLLEYRINTDEGIKWIREKALLTGDSNGSLRIFKESNEITTEVRYNERFSGPEYALSVISRKIYLDVLDSIAEGYSGFTSPVYFSLLLIDINRFRDINMVHGNRVGDKVLEIVFFQIKNMIRKTDRLFRTNGDNFAVILTAVSRERDVIKIAEKILRLFREPLKIDSMSINIEINMGIAVYPSDGDTGEVLNKNAELALIHAKKSDSPYIFSSESLNTDAMVRLQITETLKKSLVQDEFYLHYQPIFESEYRIAGYEALLRWDGSGSGFSIQDIIEIAETTSLMEVLGEWIYNKAFEDFVKILSRNPDLFVSVNISPVQLQTRSFISKIHNSAMQAGIPLNQVHLEITETTFMRDRNLLFEKISRLSALGFIISMDDFGTGYSSLASLRKLPFQVIKLDREFILEIPESSEACSFFDAAVQMIISAGKRLIIEGVETEEQFEYIKQSGVNIEFQGYHFSRPLSFDSFTELIKAYRK